MEILVNLIGGIALLLWGIRMVRTGVTRAFGAPIRKALARSAGNRLSALAVGFGFTAVLQSSTATALITSSLAGRGYIPLAAALAIMLGADIGTTMVVQFFSLDIRWLSPLLIAIGVFMFLSSDESRRRALARIFIGLGLMLLSLQLIVATSLPLRESEAVSVLMRPLTDEPILAVLVAAGITWLAHSSVAIVLLVMSMAALQVISIQLALALVIGANLGGALTPVVISLGGPAAARRVSVGNLMVRGFGCIVALAVLPWLQPYLAMIHDSTNHIIANFHTAFNLAIAILFLPFIGPVSKAVTRLVPDRIAEGENGTPKYLEDSTLSMPAEALASATRETLRMGDEVEKMLEGTIDVFKAGDARQVKEIEQQDDIVDNLHEAIKLFVTRITESELDTLESKRAIEILTFTTNLEHIGDIVDKNLMDLASKKIKGKMSFSDEGLEELITFHERVVANFKLSLNIFVSGDISLARQLLRDKAKIRELEREYVDNHYQRVGAGRPESIESSSLHLDVLRDLKRINSHLTAVVYPILERAGELKPASRLAPVE
ncbi:MAG: Na/Pi cotransporter family protein [Alphaproteobacteria bacterium]